MLVTGTTPRDSDNRDSGNAAASAAQTREAVALFDDQDKLQGAIDALLEARFLPSDLSILSSHESIEAARHQGGLFEDMKTALGSDLKYLGPLAAAGLIMLAAGPMAAVLTALVAAGIGGLAMKELMDETTSAPHVENFTRALEAGAVILWVRVDDAAREAQALDILTGHGGDNAHINQRDTTASESSPES